MKAKTKRQESILWIEAAGFGLMVVFVWITELLRVPHVLFAEAEELNWTRVLARTAVVVGVWIVVHLATKRLLKRLHHLEEYLQICAWCRKIGHNGEWMVTEDYFGTNFHTRTSHGMCPECSRAMRQSAGLDRKVGQ